MEKRQQGEDWVKADEKPVQPASFAARGENPPGDDGTSER